jgi:hypothetical protein
VACDGVLVPVDAIFNWTRIVGGGYGRVKSARFLLGRPGPAEEFGA